MAKGNNNPLYYFNYLRNGVVHDVDDEYGQEIDITAKYKLFKNFEVVAGYSHYFVGDFFEDTNNGRDVGTVWFYLQTTMKF